MIHLDGRVAREHFDLLTRQVFVVVLELVAVLPLCLLLGHTLLRLLSFIFELLFKAGALILNYFLHVLLELGVEHLTRQL